MIPAAITMTVLTHPLQVLLMGMIVLRGVQGAIAVDRQTWWVWRPRSGSHPRPVAGRSDLQPRRRTGRRSAMHALRAPRNGTSPLTPTPTSSASACGSSVSS
jgi:hypothetical protein